jgi:hypothetical protein
MLERWIQHETNVLGMEKLVLTIHKMAQVGRVLSTWLAFTGRTNRTGRLMGLLGYVVRKPWFLDIKAKKIIQINFCNDEKKGLKSLDPTPDEIDPTVSRPKTD